MTSTTITLEDHVSVASSLRRMSLKPRKASTNDVSTTVDSKGSSQDQPRRSSLAVLSKLRRSKKGQKNLEPQYDSDNQLGQLFLELPTEIVTHIISFLQVGDVLALRITSKPTLSLVQVNSRTIALQQQRDRCLESAKIAPISKLYPPLKDDPSDVYLLQYLHREQVIQQQLRVVLTFLQTRVYMLKLNATLQCQQFAPYRAGLYANLYMPAWYAQHLLESVRNLITFEHPSHSPLAEKPTISSCKACMTSTKAIITSYPQKELVNIYQLIQLLVLHLRAATRAPSIVSNVERKLRGWGTGPLPEQQVGQLLFFGNLEEVSKINEMEGSYGKRFAFVTSFINKLTEAARVNTIAWPNVPPTDPVMAAASPRSQAGLDSDVTKSLDPAYATLTHHVLNSIPEVDTFLLGPESPMGQRLIAENLVNHQRELLSPYGWVQRLMASCYHFGDERSYSINGSNSNSSQRNMSTASETLASDGEHSDGNETDDIFPRRMEEPRPHPVYLHTF